MHFNISHHLLDNYFSFVNIIFIKFSINKSIIYSMNKLSNLQQMRRIHQMQLRRSLLLKIIKERNQREIFNELTAHRSNEMIFGFDLL